ncbi:hypothetical protein QE109_09550 [Fusibacter bizertensis]|uniref:DUF4868 domain-containing protein n=1 Tax=Fusibacter bizertensis TaxID=1488331 RepID=A0ABT6ND90_9FIRM|nr:hypothetical protein [Fusibacter bizertensis]MDH8678390.1 hypothetical protein [Fusibacter bizertensis]
MNIEMIEKIYNDLYEFIVMPSNKKELDIAKQQFVLKDDQSDTDGFAEWLIFNYLHSETHQNMIDRFKLKQPLDENKEAVAILEALKKSQRSIFEVNLEHERVALKDIFTNDDFLLESGVSESTPLISARVISIDNTHTVVGDIFELEVSFKESIKKYILDQYNQFTQSQGITPMDSFLDANGHLLYKVLDIVNQVEEENAYEDELNLYQSTYAYRCNKDELYELFMTLSLPVFADEEEEPILRVMEEDRILAEIEISNGQFYVLCNSPEHSKAMKKVIEPILRADIVFLKDEIFSLEDLL